MLVSRSDNIDTQITVRLFVKAGAAEPGPPLGTVLGNLGVNASKFCKEFNAYTSELPKYMMVKVRIVISPSRQYTFSVEPPATGYIVSLLKFERTFVVPFCFTYTRKRTFECVLLSDLIKLSKFKFPDLPLEQSFKIVWGSVKSAHLRVIC